MGLPLKRKSLEHALKIPPGMTNYKHEDKLKA